MSKLHVKYSLSDRLIRAISNWRTFGCYGDTVERLLDMGADINKGEGTLLPLHCAAMVGDVSCLELLISRGARVNGLDGYTRTALHYAAEKDAECVQKLVDSGAQVDALDGNADTPLHWAAFKDNFDAAEILLKHGASVNHADFNGATPLHWASHKGNVDIVRLLVLDYNADVNIRTNDGKTALFNCASIQAIGLNDPDDDASFELLLELGDCRALISSEKLAIKCDQGLAERLLEGTKRVRTLKELCRLKVRQAIGPNFLDDAVKRLPPLPGRIVSFLLYEEL